MDQNEVVQCEEQCGMWPTAAGLSASERTSLDRAAIEAGPDGAVVVGGEEAALYFDAEDYLATLDPRGLVS